MAMTNFELLGPFADQLREHFQKDFYILLPLFFGSALAISWFRDPFGGDLLECVKRAFVSVLLLVAFKEIANLFLAISDGISDQVGRMDGMEGVMRVLAEQTHTSSSDIFINLTKEDGWVGFAAMISSTIALFFHRIMLCVYNFSWTFLTVIAPLVLSFHVFSPKMTLNFFRSLAEIAAWQPVWAILSAMLKALPFAEALGAKNITSSDLLILDGILTLCLLGAPFIVHFTVGSGFSTFASALGPLLVATAGKTPGRLRAATGMTRTALNASSVVGDPQLRSEARAGLSSFGNKVADGVIGMAKKAPLRHQSPPGGPIHTPGNVDTTHGQLLLSPPKPTTTPPPAVVTPPPNEGPKKT
jgi:hypothetical protein